MLHGGQGQILPIPPEFRLHVCQNLLLFPKRRLSSPVRIESFPGLGLLQSRCPDQNLHLDSLFFQRLARRHRQGRGIHHSGQNDPPDSLRKYRFLRPGQGRLLRTAHSPILQAPPIPPLQLRPSRPPFVILRRVHHPRRRGQSASGLGRFRRQPEEAQPQIRPSPGIGPFPTRLTHPFFLHGQNSFHPGGNRLQRRGHGWVRPLGKAGRGSRPRRKKNGLSGPGRLGQTVYDSPACLGSHR